MVSRPLLALTAALMGVAPLGAQPPSSVPTGARIGPSGYATITDAPPVPFSPAPPQAPPARSPAQVAADDRFAEVGRFQNRVRGEVQALADRLRRAEAGNFVTLYFDNDGELSVVFQFLRDGRATLARYTRNPAFRAETVRFTEAQLRQAGEFMMRTFGPDRVIDGMGTGANNRMNVTITVPEPEFRALVARKRVAVPDAVALTFAADQSAASLNRPLPASIAPLVRIFPRDDRPVGVVNAINSTAKVELRDGCFRAPEHDAWVLFPLGAQLLVDGQGYLAFGPADQPGQARVGETLVFMGSVAEVTAPELVGPIHVACGRGKVIKVNATRSAAAETAQRVVTENAWTLRQFRESYGLSQADAERALRACLRRQRGSICMLTPPPPVRSQAECPAGTRLLHGMCRTPQGHVRPLPAWLRALMEDAQGPGAG